MFYPSNSFKLISNGKVMLFQKNFLKKTGSISIRLIFLIFFFYAIYNHLWHVLLANSLIFLLLLAPAVLRRAKNIHIPFEFEMLFFLFLLLTILLGQFSAFFVQIIFGFTMGLLGFVFIFIYFPKNEEKPHYILLTFLACCVSLALATLVEIGKYGLKSLLDFGITQGDYLFAIINLSAVFCGSVFFSILGLNYFYGKHNKFFKKLVLRFKVENPNLFLRRNTLISEVSKLISGGEGEKVEFKSTLRINLNTLEPDKRIEYSILRSLVSFLNSSGGYLFIGVNDKGQITGLDNDKFENLDMFNRHLTNLLKQRLGSEYLPFLGFDFFNIGGKKILRITCMKSSKPVFLKNEDREEFFVRVGASSIQLSGNKILEYVSSRFN